METHRGKLDTAGRIILGAIFLAAGAAKLASPDDFAASVQSFKLVPEMLIPVVRDTMPTLEILAAIGLFIPKIKGGAIATITLLCAGFCGFYIWAIALGITPHCGCFGNNPILQANPVGGLVRAAVLTALAALIWRKD